MQKNRPGFMGISTYHDYENTDKDGNKVSEKGQGMLHIIQISEVSFLNNFLGVHHNVANKHQQPKV